MKEAEGKLRPGSVVYVPWGLDRRVPGRVVEVWGDPPAHVRVELAFADADPDEEPVVLLLPPDLLSAA